MLFRRIIAHFGQAGDGVHKFFGKDRLQPVTDQQVHEPLVLIEGLDKQLDGLLCTRARRRGPTGHNVKENVINALAQHVLLILEKVVESLPGHIRRPA